MRLKFLAFVLTYAGVFGILAAPVAALCGFVPPLSGLLILIASLLTLVLGHRLEFQRVVLVSAEPDA